MNIEEGIRRVYSGPTHIVILGAGASIASAKRNPEPDGKSLPSMDSLVEDVGLGDLVQGIPAVVKSCNFEDLYSGLYEVDDNSLTVREIERRVSSYFRSIKLPPGPTLYDYLVLSLRPKDLIATFNWDPFLYDACRRNHTKASLPRVAYLHGNVRIGYCLQDRRKGLDGVTSRQVV